MTSRVDQGGNSTGHRIPVSIKAEGMLNTPRIMKQLWSPTHADKARKRKALFEVDNWDERQSKMQCLVASAKGFLKEDLLQNRRMVFKDDSKDELQVKRLSHRSILYVRYMLPLQFVPLSTNQHRFSPPND